ncbi:hypothetical protein ACOSQ2_033285 [Xanthoceras sorbifolium]
MGRDSSSKSLAPGFRFHPTDEELVRYYLKRKVCNKPFRFDPISVIDIYRSEPWDLPDKSRLKSRDLEWYFFSMLDKKYGNGSRTNRATEKGYWKTTGKDRPILHNSRNVGMKKTLVYHLGRAPRGERTNWVMHEYRLVDEELEKTGTVQDAFVLCRIFQKSGSGPKNGEQYGAPFIEEEWEDDEVVEEAIIPGQEMVADEVVVGDDAYVETNDLEQIVDIAIQSENAPPLNFFYGDSSNFVEHSRDLSENEQKPIIGTRETRGPELRVGQQFSDLPEQYEMDTRSVKDEYVVESSNNVDPNDVNYLLDEPFMDATAHPPFGDGLYLEANDLSNTIEPNSAGFDMVEEYLNFFDANDDNAEYLTFDASEILGSENNLVPDQAPLTSEVNGGSEQESVPSQLLSEAHGNDAASSSKQKQETSTFESDVKHPFLKQASQMLGGIHAPPAFASEFPTKDAALRLNSMAQASSSVHVTAGMIRIRNVTLTGTGVDWSFGKNGDVNIILSFDVSQSDASPATLVPVSSSLYSKTGSVVSRSLFLLMCFWVLILSVSIKIGSYIYTK